MSPFERRLKILQYVLRSGKKVTSNEILDSSIIDINQASLNNLLKRLVRDGFLVSTGKSTHIRYYEPSQKSKENIKA